MTWEQAVAAALAIAVTALARLVDYWLPPRGPSLAEPGQIPPRRRVPTSEEVDWVDETEAAPPPQPRQPPEPGPPPH